MKFPFRIQRIHGILFVLFLTALIIRIWNLGSIPNGFHADEVDAGYIGKYLLLHGKDIAGHFLPLHYNKFGDYRPTGIFYLVGVSSLLFGNQEFGVRLPGALFGALTIIAFYYLVYEIFEDKWAAFAGSVLLTFLPWHIVLSRATSEGIIGLFWVVWGMVFLIRAYKRKEGRDFVWGGIFFLLSYLFYHTFRFLVPFIVFPFIWYPQPKEMRKKSIGLVAVLFILSAFLLLSQSGGGRFKQVAFYNKPDLLLTIKRMEMGEGQNNVLTARIFHNKPVIYVRELLSEYLSYFSPDFLVNKGGLPFRYAVPEQGLISYTVLGCIFGGFLFLMTKKYRDFVKRYLLYLLLIAPVPAAITYEDAPNVHRSLFLMIPLVLLAVIGFRSITDLLRRQKALKTVVLTGLAIIFSVEFVYFMHQYTVHAGSDKSVLRNDGNTQLIMYLKNQSKKYDAIYLSRYDDLPIYYLFFTGQYRDIPKELGDPGSNVTVGNIHFVKEECPTKIVTRDEIAGKKVLIVDGGNCQDKQIFSPIQTIMRDDSTKAYTVFESRE